MTRTTRVTVAIVVATFLALVATAFGDTVTLKGEAYVKGPSVLLGDVAEIEGEEAEFLRTIEIAPAAMPGTARRVDASLVRARLNRAGVEDAEFDLQGNRHTLATTMHLEVTRGMLAEDLRSFVRREMPWEIEAAIVEVSPPSTDYVVSDGVLDIVWRPNPQYQYLGSGSFRGEIMIDGELQKTFFAKAKVEAYEDVVVASVPVSRGDALSGRNVRLERRELSTLRAGAFFSLQEVAGQVARGTLQAGQVITPQKIAAPILVKRNQVIPVETRLGALTIRSRGRVMSDAAAGELISCMNLGSKDEFVGVLRKDGVLVVD